MSLLLSVGLGLHSLLRPEQPLRPPKVLPPLWRLGENAFLHRGHVRDSVVLCGGVPWRAVRCGGVL